ncbi:Uncharacterised protein [uncultured archaeon]|nr:Uncharacterised protein [uncultured archaeon]
MHAKLNPSPEVCVRCKGRLWCGSNCFILEKHAVYDKTVSNIQGLSFSGSSPPGFFVSRHGYPKVSVAPLSPTEHLKDAWLLDDSDRWFGMPEQEVISFRQQLVRSQAYFNAESAASPSYELLGLQELVMASKPVDVEVELKAKPVLDVSFSDSFAPMGPQADLERISNNENVKVDPRIDSLVSDGDVKAAVAMQELFSKGIGVNQLHKLLSAGVLGIRKRRRLTPTRWSITAVDSNLSDYILEERVKHFPSMNEILLFESHYLDNHFFVLLLPREWSFEQLEAWKPGGVWTGGASEPSIISDYETYAGRKGYADNVAGAYYAARLAVCEYLLAKRRQASAIIFREIGADYRVPLGVWVVRQTLRDSFSKTSLSFSSFDLALAYISKRLSIPINYWIKQSKILDDATHQKRLADFCP